MFIDRQVYCEALEASLNTICFDRASGERFSFEKLFYPLELDEGKYAFQSYSEQMEQARKNSENAISHHPKTALGKEIFEKIEGLQSELAKKEQEDKLGETQDSSYAIPENDNKPVTKNSQLSSEIKERIERLRFRQSSERKIDIVDETEDTLLNESKYDHRSLIVSGVSPSRILIVASAGHGKTTLLRRIALYYCHPLSNSEDHRQLKDRYSLSGEYIPCLIRLRDITNSDFSIEKAIENSVLEALYNYYSEKDVKDAVKSGAINKWIEITKNDYILLIDGLDELSDKTRYDFLLALDHYASMHSETPIILTSRVAGLAQTGVKEQLRKLHFRGRSIIPLMDEQAKEYSFKWIEYTQPEEQHAPLFDAVEQILKQDRFNYLKEFMRTPLELLVILKQLITGTLSLNRYQMFHDDLLSDLLTRHVKRYDQKDILFEDMMTVLSFIAYTMQKNNTLYISSKDLEALQVQLSGLSFHTDIIHEGKTEDYVSFLNDLASNVGIIERDDRTNEYVYTFPIRAYQEYLTAHACCHLRLDATKSKPEPSEIVKKHLHDRQWLNVFIFILSDLSINNQGEFDRLIPLIFSEFKELDVLKDIVEANLAITKSHATVLCNNVFSGKYIGKAQKELLISCMGTQSAYAYAYALMSLFKENTDNQYLEATAFSSIIWDYNTGHSPLKDAEKRINSGEKNDAILGATIISILIRFVFNEEPLSENSDISGKIDSEMHLTETLLEKLSKNAFQYSEPIFMEALTDIWISKVEGSALAKKYLTKKAGELILSSLKELVPDILKIYTSETDITQISEFLEFQNLVYALGSLPIIKSLIIHKTGNTIIAALLETLYDVSKDDVSMDQTAIAVACLYYCWTWNQFLDAWTFDICKGLPLEYVRKDLCGIREQNHFSLIKRPLEAPSEKYREIKQQDYNVYITTNEKSVFSLFREQDYLGAAQFCLKTMGKIPSSNAVNLAFLMRYGKLSAEEVGEGSLSITELLEDGVNNHEVYAVLNMALYKLQINDYDGADVLLKSLSREEWSELTTTFWIPELWNRDHDSEGALVGILANKYKGLEFDDYELMLQTVKNQYPQLLENGLIIQ